jgi:hypothetical protein
MAKDKKKKAYPRFSKVNQAKRVAKWREENKRRWDALFAKSKWRATLPDDQSDRAP